MPPPPGLSHFLTIPMAVPVTEPDRGNSFYPMLSYPTGARSSLIPSAERSEHRSDCAQWNIRD
ncbi:MAG: hypothetical protein Kow0074_05930 [Candidatus Zixiibacteriota bacterium]